MIDSNVVEHMVENNGDHNFKKAIEELQELALVLMQKINKPVDGAPTEQNIIDEIGDVKIRLTVLEELYSKEKVAERIKYKMDKFRGYIETKKYSKF